MSSDSLTPKEAKSLFGSLLKAVAPGLDHAYPIRARVVAARASAGVVDAAHKRYSCDVRPLPKDGTDDPDGPVLKDVEMSPLWVGADTAVLAVPPVGAIVRVGFYYGDPGQPFVDAVLADGFSVPAGSAGVWSVQAPGGRVDVGPTGISALGSVVLGGVLGSPVLRVADVVTLLNHSHEVVPGTPVFTGPGVPVNPTLGSPQVRAS